MPPKRKTAKAPPKKADSSKANNQPSPPAPQQHAKTQQNTTNNDKSTAAAAAVVDAAVGPKNESVVESLDAALPPSPASKILAQQASDLLNNNNTSTLSVLARKQAALMALLTEYERSDAAMMLAAQKNNYGNNNADDNSIGAGLGRGAAAKGNPPGTNHHLHPFGSHELSGSLLAAAAALVDMQTAVGGNAAAANECGAALELLSGLSQGKLSAALNNNNNDFNSNTNTNTHNSAAAAAAAATAGQQQQQQQAHQKKVNANGMNATPQHTSEAAIRTSIALNQRHGFTAQQAANITTNHTTAAILHAAAHHTHNLHFPKLTPQQQHASSAAKRILLANALAAAAAGAAAGAQQHPANIDAFLYSDGGLFGGSGGGEESAGSVGSYLSEISAAFAENAARKRQKTSSAVEIVDDAQEEDGEGGAKACKPNNGADDDDIVGKGVTHNNVFLPPPNRFGIYDEDEDDDEDGDYAHGAAGRGRSRIVGERDFYDHEDDEDEDEDGEDDNDALFGEDMDAVDHFNDAVAEKLRRNLGGGRMGTATAARHQHLLACFGASRGFDKGFKTVNLDEDEAFRVGEKTTKITFGAEEGVPPPSKDDEAKKKKTANTKDSAADADKETAEAETTDNSPSSSGPTTNTAAASENSKGRGLVATRDYQSRTVITSCRPDIAVLYSSHVKTHCAQCYQPLRTAANLAANSNKQFDKGGAHKAAGKGGNNNYLGNFGGGTNTLQPAYFMCEFCFNFALCEDCNHPRVWDEHHLPCRWFCTLPQEVQENDTDYIRFLLNYCARIQGGDRRLMYAVESLCSNEAQQRENVKKFCSSYSKLVATTFAPQGLLISQDHLYHTLLRTKSNAIGFPFDSNATLGWAVQLDVCMVNHSCNPNCAITQAANGCIELRALRPIFKGEEITIAYINIPAFPDVRTRIAHLWSEYRFKCSCELCTEQIKQLAESGATMPKLLP